MMMKYNVKHMDFQMWTMWVEADSKEDALEKALNKPENERVTKVNVYETDVVDEMD